jgi:hypothetical protein
MNIIFDFSLNKYKHATFARRIENTPFFYTHDLGMFFFSLYVFWRTSGPFFTIFSSLAPHRGQPAAKCHPRWQPARRWAISCGLGRHRIRTRDCRTTVWRTTIEPPLLHHDMYMYMYSYMCLYTCDLVVYPSIHLDLGESMSPPPVALVLFPFGGTPIYRCCGESSYIKSDQIKSIYFPVGDQHPIYRY